MTELYDAAAIRALLGRHGFKFSRSKGQNFLIDGAVPERMVEMSGIGPEYGVLEIGPGIGALTVPLAARAGRVLAVELDRLLAPILNETLGCYGNVKLLYGDILGLDIKELIRRELNGFTPAVCANLPYNITTPALTKLIDSGLFSSITVMVQREVALRICAAPGSADYGAFTVYASYYTEPEYLFEVPPESFIPAPKVVSAVVRLTRRDTPPVNGDRALFFRVVRAAFMQRRKTLVNALAASFGDRLPKEELTRAVSLCGLDERIRGEALGLAGFSAVANAIAERLIE